MNLSVAKAIKVLGLVAIVVSHAFLSYADFFGGLASADFLLRVDGSRSIATALTPLEATFVALVGLPHFVIVLLIGAALLVPRMISLRGAVFASFVVHAAWAAHIITRATQWRGLFHPHSVAITYEFFLGAHASWAAISLAVLGADINISNSNDNYNNNSKPVKFKTK